MKLIARVHLLIFSLSLGLATASEPAPPFAPAVADDTMNALFQQRDGWIGADGAYSVALSAERTLWLFGDTWVGRIRDGRRVDSVMVNNSVAIQDGKGNDARVKFFVRRDATSKPTALIAPADGRGWFWPQAGILIGGRLHLFLAQIEKSGGNGVFSFRQIGQSLGIVDNPAEEPTSWHVVQRKLPCAVFTGQRQTCFGTAVLQVGDDVYVFGTDEDRQVRPLKRFLIVGRVPAERFSEFDQWRFFCDGRWTDDYRTASRLTNDMGSEGSVSYLPKLKQYLLIYTENGLSANILCRTAPAPFGPWSAPVKLYQCSEAAMDTNLFCYAAKGHAELCGDDELLVTYAVNSLDFWQVARDARLYWPRFVRVKVAVH